jgi:molecular chaperone DnaK
MKAEAEQNAENDKKERERIDKLNQADSMIFQTETFLNENGDKLGADKANVEAAVQQLKDAHKSGDITAIDNAINNLNTVMQAASQKMYQQAGGAQPGPDMNAGAGQQQTGGNTSNDETIQDADFEEVK